MGSNGVRRYSPTIMTGEGKQETEDFMRVMLERGAKMLVTNPGTVTNHMKSAAKLANHVA